MSAALSEDLIGVIARTSPPALTRQALDEALDRLAQMDRERRAAREAARLAAVLKARSLYRSYGWRALPRPRITVDKRRRKAGARVTYVCRAPGLCVKGYGHTFALAYGNWLQEIRGL